MNRTGASLMIVAGVVVALYALRANAATNTGADGDTGAWWPDLSLPDLSLPDFGIDTAPGVSYGTPGYFPTNAPDQIASGDIVSAPDPGINFGILSDLGAIVSGWKTGDYNKYASAIRDAEISNGIPQDLLARLLYQESRFKPDVIAGYDRSPVGAIGIAQFMPATAAEMGLSLVASSYNGTPTQTYDPFASIAAAGRYLKRQFNSFNDWRLALMAYNWGPGNVSKWLRAGKSYPPAMETSTYVAQITAAVPIA